MPFGDSYSAVQQADLAERGMARAGLESALGRLLNALQQRKGNEMAAQEMALRQRLAQEDRGYRQDALGLQRQLLDRDLIQSGEANTFARQEAGRRNTINEGMLQLQKDQFKWQSEQPSVGKLRAEEFRLKRIDDLAQQGGIKDLLEAQALLPDGTPEQHQYFTERSLTARKGKADTWRLSDSLARAQNRFLELDDEINQPSQSWWKGKDKKAIANAQSERQRLSAYLDANKKNLNLIALDPETNRYVSAIDDEWRPTDTTTAPAPDRPMPAAPGGIGAILGVPLGMTPEVAPAPATGNPLFPFGEGPGAAGGLAFPGMSTPSAPSMPRRVRQNGRIYIWDGTQYVPE